MSRLPFEFFLALRYLRPKRTFVSIITLISVLGVTLGVTVLVVVMSVMSGFDKQLRDKLLGFHAHIRILKNDTALSNPDELIARLRNNPEIKGISPFLLGRVLIKTQPEFGNALSDAPVLRGVDPKHENDVSKLLQSVIMGTNDLEGRSVLIGIQFARMMRLHVGDKILIYSPRDLERMEQKRGKPDEEGILPREFMIKGIFDVGYYEFNAQVIVTALENAQDLYNLNDNVHGLFVMLKDPFRAPRVRDHLWSELGPNFNLTLWSEDNSEILDAVLVEKNVMFIILFFIMIVAAFGIMNSQITFVVQKTREIGMLKALGATPGNILGLFLGQGIFVGLVGVVTGFGLGLLALAYRNPFRNFMSKFMGIELFPAKIYNLPELPALIVPRDLVLICAGAFIACILAGLIPAWQAARLQPVEALRHE